MLNALVAGNLDDLAPHFMHIVPLLTSSLKSRVIAQQCCDLYLKLRMAVFESEDDVFGELGKCIQFQSINQSVRFY